MTACTLISVPAHSRLTALFVPLALTGKSKGPRRVISFSALHRMFSAFLGALALALCPSVHAQSVTTGFGLYTGATFNCKSCHINPVTDPAVPPGVGGTANHRNASNNPAQIVTGLTTAGEML